MQVSTLQELINVTYDDGGDDDDDDDDVIFLRALDSRQLARFIYRINH